MPILSTIALLALVATTTMATSPVIGIDFGTTKSAVAVFKQGRPEIIANELGARLTPSWVAFTSTGETLVGEGAKSQGILNAENTIMDIKRLLGMRYDSPSVQKDKLVMPYTIVDHDGAAWVRVTVKNETKIISPEEIAAMILRKVKESAEAYLGVPVTHAVITVPAFASEAARQATKDAAAIAGLTVLRLISEPTSASLAYGLDKTHSHERNICVFDHGGGTLDVTLLTLDDGVTEVLATSGDVRNGGEDVTDIIVKHVLKQFERRTGLDASKDKRAIQRLRREADRAKIALSTQPQVQLELEAFHAGRELTEMLTRARFEELCSDIFKRALEPVKQVLADAKLTPSDISDVLLVGGTSRVPKIQAMLEAFFGKPPMRSINPEEAVALGAAIQAALLAGDDTINQEMTIIDVIALSQGIETTGQIMTTVVPRNSHIPTSMTKMFSTASDDQESVVIRVFEGERPLTKDNRLLGEFTVSGIAPAPRGTPQIEVTFSIDANSLLTVKATNKASGHAEEIRIHSDKGRLSQAEIDRLLAEATQYKTEDDAKRASIASRNAFETAVYAARNTAKSSLTGDEASAVADEVARAIDWLDQNPNAVPKQIEERRAAFDKAVGGYLQNKDGAMPNHDDL